MPASTMAALVTGVAMSHGYFCRRTTSHFRRLLFVVPRESGDEMRTEQVHLAMRETSNRYELCQLTWKAVHALHKRGERMQDSINQVLGKISRAALNSPDEQYSNGLEGSGRASVLSLTRRRGA
jgi:hypothetical protein